MPGERANPKRSTARAVIRAVLLLLVLASLFAWYESTVRNIELLHRGEDVFYMTGGRIEISEFFAIARPGTSARSEWHLRAPLSVSGVSWRWEWGRDAG